MDQRSIQLCLSLLDTIHDYGNTSRVKKVISKNTDKQEFNPAFIIDFLMLGYLHNYFRDLIGISKGQYYLKKEQDCTAQQFFSSSNTSIPNEIRQFICRTFYFPTYSDRIIYRSPDPEKMTKDILFEYLKILGIKYNEEINAWWDDDTQNLLLHSCVNFLLGDKDADDENAGIYNIEDVSKQSEELYNKLSNYYGYPITYVTDANQMNSQWFCVYGKHITLYNGVFTEYDSFKQGINQKGGSGVMDLTDMFSSLTMNKNGRNVGKSKAKLVNCLQKEFQDYQLTRKANELLRLEYLQVKQNQLNHMTVYNNKGLMTKEFPIEKDLKSSKSLPRGLSMFLLLFNEINKKTLGYLNFDRGDAKKLNLKEDINKVGYESLKFTYKIALNLLDNDPAYALLSPVDYVLARSSNPNNP